MSKKDSDVRDLPRVSLISGFRERLMNKKVALGDRLVLGLKERLRKEQVQEKKLWTLSPKTRRRGKKGKAATKDRNMAAVVFLSHTAVILTMRSSSHPCGVRMESPNLFAALFDLVAYGGPRSHTAVVAVSVYMP